MFLSLKKWLLVLIALIPIHLSFADENTPFLQAQLVEAVNTAIDTRKSLEGITKSIDELDAIKNHIKEANELMQHKMGAIVAFGDSLKELKNSIDKTPNAVAKKLVQKVDEIKNTALCSTSKYKEFLTTDKILYANYFCKTPVKLNKLTLKYFSPAQQENISNRVQNNFVYKTDLYCQSNKINQSINQCIVDAVGSGGNVDANKVYNACYALEKNRIDREEQNLRGDACFIAIEKEINKNSGGGLYGLKGEGIEQLGFRYLQEINANNTANNVIANNTANFDSKLQSSETLSEKMSSLLIFQAEQIKLNIIRNNILLASAKFDVDRYNHDLMENKVVTNYSGDLDENIKSIVANKQVNEFCSDTVIKSYASEYAVLVEDEKQQDNFNMYAIQSSFKERLPSDYKLIQVLNCYHAQVYDKLFNS